MSFKNIILQFLPDSRTATDRARAEAARKDAEDLLAQAQQVAGLEWGGIAGDIEDQADLYAEILAREDKAKKVLGEDSWSGAPSDLKYLSEKFAKQEFDKKADLVAGKVPQAQLPSYVDDVEPYADFASLPATGENGKIYITEDDNKTYRWNGASYTEISASLALGETSATAYRGDRGKTAYNHSQESGTNPHGVDADDVGLGNADNAHHVAVASTATDIDFTRPKIFHSPGSPRTGNITEDLTGSVIGVVQKIYHNAGTEPTFPAGWVKLNGSQDYVTSSLNIIYCEWVSASRVEYWIVQEAS